MAWFKTNGQSGDQYLYAEAHATATDEYSLYLNGGTVKGHYDDGSTSATLSASKSATDGAWHNLVAVKN